MKAKQIKRIRKRFNNERWLSRELEVWTGLLESVLFFEGEMNSDNPQYQNYLNSKKYYTRKVNQIKNLIINLK